MNHAQVTPILATQTSYDQVQSVWKVVSLGNVFRLASGKSLANNSTGQTFNRL